MFTEDLGGGLPAEDLAGPVVESESDRFEVLGAPSGQVGTLGEILAVVLRLTEVVGEAASDPTLTDRIYVPLTESYDGGWGLAGHANTNQELFALTQAALAG